MKDSTIALLAVAGLGAYLWYKNKNQAAATAALTASPGAATPVAPVTPGAQQTAVDLQAAGAVQSGAVVTNDLCKNRVTTWFNTLSAGNKAQAFAMLPQMTEDELTALCLIFDEWAAGHVAPPALAQKYIDFWNSWRVKYHILDGTYK